jgi:hypothetical protein
MALLLAPAAAAQAAAPANDDFANATPLVAGAPTIHTDNLGATGEPNEPAPAHGSVTPDQCANPGDAPDCSSSIWFTFTPDQSVSYSIETCDLGTELDTVLGVYTGTALNALTEVGSNDDACPGGYGPHGSRVQFTATSGTTYYVQVQGYSDVRGPLYLRAYDTASPPAATTDTQILRADSFAQAKAIGNNQDVSSEGRLSPSFAFMSPAADATFECSLDGGAFAPCTSPQSYDSLNDGAQHTFSARATSGAVTDPTPALQIYTPDTTPPDTTITSGPEGDVAVATATWKALGSELFGYGTMVCSLDGQPQHNLNDTCGYTESFNGFCAGPHIFRTAAADPAGNVDPTPATRAINVTAGTPCSAPVMAAPGATDNIVPTAATVHPTFASSTGEGGTLRVDYGTTTAYGTSLPDYKVPPNSSGISQDLQYLEPSTLYHWKATLTTPSGTTDTGDQTFTTSAPGVDQPPSISVGTPVAVGSYALHIPVTIDAHGSNTGFTVYVQDGGGPATLSSPRIGDTVDVPDLPSGPQERSVDIVDMTPGTTYSIAVTAESSFGGTATFGQAPVTVTTPALPGPSEQPPATTPTTVTPPPTPPGNVHFVLKSSLLKLVGKISRRSKSITILASGLPSGTRLSGQLLAGKKKLASGSATAAAAPKKGTARLTFKLSKKARKRLKSKKLKSLTLKVTARPPGDTPSTVSLKRKLKR